MKADASPLRKISPNATVCFAILVGIAVSLVAAPDGRGLFGAALAGLMGAIAAIDARRFVIPDLLTACALMLGLVRAGIEGAPFAVEAIALSVLRGAAAALVLLAIRAGYRMLRGREGLGLGDVKLAGVAGVWVGATTLVVVVEIAAVAALAVYAVRQFVSGRALRMSSRLPFGFYLAPAIWVGWLVEIVVDRWVY